MSHGNIIKSVPAQPRELDGTADRRDLRYFDVPVWAANRRDPRYVDVPGGTADRPDPRYVDVSSGNPVHRDPRYVDVPRWESREPREIIVID